MCVIDRLQRRIVDEHNASVIKSGKSVSLNELRLAALRHSDIAFWVKYNRVREGTLTCAQCSACSSQRRFNDYFIGIVRAFQTRGVLRRLLELTAISLPWTGTRQGSEFGSPYLHKRL